MAILLPHKGVSQLDSPGGMFWDPAADAACYDTIKAMVKPGVQVIDLDLNINDPEFADKAVEVLLGMMIGASRVIMVFLLKKTRYQAIERNEDYGIYYT